MQTRRGKKLTLKIRWYEICFDSGKIIKFNSRYEDIKQRDWFRDVLWIEPMLNQREKEYVHA